jgi:hypothetical protein
VAFLDFVFAYLKKPTFQNFGDNHIQKFVARLTTKQYLMVTTARFRHIVINTHMKLESGTKVSSRMISLSLRVAKKSLSSFHELKCKHTHTHIHARARNDTEHGSLLYLLCTFWEGKYVRNDTNNCCVISTDLSILKFQVF